MTNLPANLQTRLKEAIGHFWTCRGTQAESQGGEAGDKDRGSRAAVTGGKHLDGFLKLIAALLEEAGLQRSHIYWQEKTELPGWFRAEKDWDLLVVADGKLIAITEFKSQVGSFGNNFNNRAEESIGNATDLWESYEHGAFALSSPPWLGYLMLLEDCAAVKKPVKVQEPHFKVFPEFKGASYQERYNQLMTRLVRKRLYNACCLLLSPQGSTAGDYTEPNPELGFAPFVTSLFAKASAVAQMQPPGPPAPPTIEQGSPPGDATPEPG